MPNNSDFTHLHAHTEYSMLDGVGTLAHVVAEAKNKGFRALATTEHGNVSGAIKFYKECKKNDIQPIIGCELYIVDDVARRISEETPEREKLYHTIAIVKNWDGFVSLQKLLTKAHSKEGFYYKPRVSFEQLYELKNCIVTTACVGGPLGHPDWSRKIKQYYEAFQDDFYLEMQPHNLDSNLQIINNHKALVGAKYLNRKIIATNDFHYPNQHDCHAQAALLAIRNKQTISSDDLWDFTKGLYMRSYDEMYEAFLHLQNKGLKIDNETITQCLLNTTEIVEKSEFVIPKLDFVLPDVDTADLNESDPDKALMKICLLGWKRKIKHEHDSPSGKEYFNRLSYELKVIYKQKFSKYFLLVWDIYKFCRKSGIAFGYGRGSGSGSLVCYLLGITNVDPLQYGLIFERFINPERIDLPDLDLDFQHDRRDEVYNYIAQTYKNVAHIGTFSTMNTKGVLKDVSRYKEVPFADIEAVSKEIDMVTPKQELNSLTLSKLEEDPVRYPVFTKFKENNFSVIEIAKTLEGQVRHAGVHAGGVIVSGEPLENRVGIKYNNGDPTINFDMQDVDVLGLLKIDVLGSKTVSVLNYAVETINSRIFPKYNKKLNLDLIPLDDPKTLQEFDRANTVGVFQFESTGIRNLLKKIAPNTINTIITANAMYRPGPLQFMDLYCERKKNPKSVPSSGYEKFDNVVKETYGVFIYQEQVMKIAVDCAGYTYAESDILRKKIAKSKGKEEIEKDREKFVVGCINHGGMSREDSDKIFDQIVDFGRYAFNKSHSTTYAITSYYAMWLKVHFPYEFLAAQIAMSDKKEDRKKFLLEAQRLNVFYSEPNINQSQKQCTIVDTNGTLCLLGGLNEVEGIGNAVIGEILKVRNVHSKFNSFSDFLEKLENKKIINAKVQKTLLENGVFNKIHTQQEIKTFLNLLNYNEKKKNNNLGVNLW